jgi:O-antigen biosynthesis protein
MQIARMQALIRSMCSHIREMETSRFWKIRNAWFSIKRRLGVARYGAAVPFELPQDILEAFGSDSDYAGWLAQNALRDSDADRLRDIAAILPQKPTISIIMPVYNTPERYLRAAIESVMDQVYPHWELCIADDASTSAQIRQILEEYTASDERIKVVFRSENGHISRASNSAIELASGEYLALLDHDDVLTRDALFEVALLLNRHPDADMIYSDEDKVDDDGTLSAPYFKPDWSPDTFLSKMYTCHLGVYRTAIVREIGGFRPEYDGSQDYDLVLRVTERTNRIHHIAKILYHWRISPVSAAGDPAKAKPYAKDSAVRAINEALERRGEGGSAKPFPGSPNTYLIRYPIREPKKVSVIIPTRDQHMVLDRCLHSVFRKTTYPNYEVVLVDNGSKERQTFGVFTRWSKTEPHRFRVLPLDVPFNYSRINNYAVSQSDGHFVLLLNNDTEVVTADWMEAMVEQVQRPSIGAAGALLLYPDDTIQHAGIIMQLGGVAGHPHRSEPGDAYGYFTALKTITNYAAVTGACLMVRREAYDEVGGLDEDLVIAFNDVDFCLKLLSRGYHNVFLPHVKLYHPESKTRGRDDTPTKQAYFVRECNLMLKRWNIAETTDRFYNKNLSTKTENFAIRV